MPLDGKEQHGQTSCEDVGNVKKKKNMSLCKSWKAGYRLKFAKEDQNNQNIG